MKDKAMNNLFWYDVGASVLHGAQHVFTGPGADKISGSPGGFVVEGSEALTILIYPAWDQAFHPSVCSSLKSKRNKPANHMKTHLRILSLAAALCVGLFTVNAADKQNHNHLATPKGGRLLDKTEPHAEFVVEKDRTVTINFYSADMKPVAVTTQNVTAIADARIGKVTLQFEKKGDSLLSRTKLPEGDGYNIVVQFKQTTDARPQNFRFKLDLSICGECKRPEYGCTCEH